MPPADTDTVPTSAASILVLFDIDGTLIHTDGAGLRGMNAAVEQLHGRRAALEGIRVSGRTDRAILTEVFGRWDETLTDAHVGPLLELYLGSLQRELREKTGPGFGVLPGVHEALERLESDPTFCLGLLTGNVARGAEIKLAFFDLWRRFTFGAFGDDHINRRDLVPVALANARARGVNPSHVVVIGDTPLDIDCAHAHGARAVGVATGDYPPDELSRAGADITVDTLEALHPINERLAALCGVRA